MSRPHCIVETTEPYDTHVVRNSKTQVITLDFASSCSSLQAESNPSRMSQVWPAPVAYDVTVVILTEKHKNEGRLKKRLAFDRILRTVVFIAALFIFGVAVQLLSIGFVALLTTLLVSCSTSYVHVKVLS